MRVQMRSLQTKTISSTERSWLLAQSLRSERCHPDVALIEATAGETRSEEQEAIYYPITQRHPNDVRTILRLVMAALAFAALSLALAGLLT